MNIFLKFQVVTFVFLLTFSSIIAKATLYQLESPDQRLTAGVIVDRDVKIHLNQGDMLVLAPSQIGLSIAGSDAFGYYPKVAKVTRNNADTTIPSPFYKKEVVADQYNEMTINFQGNYGIIVRMYNDGMAYRFFMTLKDEIVIEDETADFRFVGDFPIYASHVNSDAPTFEEQFFNSFETPYVYEPITKQDPRKLMILPLLVELPEGKKLCITEADLEDYPGMFLNNATDKAQLKGIFAPYPKTKVQGGHNNLQMLVTEREEYLARTKGTRSFPWRVFIVSDNDIELANNDMVYKLASPSRGADVSWIKPGKVAWDWWNDWNLYGVDFRAGINNETYEYYIDFAAERGIEYVILDEGWAVTGNADMLDIIPEIDLPRIVAYGKARNVGIILWAGYHAFNRDMERVVKHFADMGVKGFKIDFMDRDDQEMMQFYYRAAEVCARHRMLVDFHGVCKPTGLQRTYPNVLNYEAVNGLEQLKWSDTSYDMVTYDVSIPFIRMIAGPMDYTQGAMRNAVKSNYYPIWSEPMSQGTRCRQLATYVIFESPINMLCDNPSNYMREEECTEFIATIPTVWDETVALKGKVSEYVAIARRQGDQWYVGALTNWEAREMELDLSFLGEGTYRIELFRDGINADRAARDYKKEVIPVPANRKLSIKMAPGGGFAARIFKQ